MAVPQFELDPHLWKPQTEALNKVIEHLDNGKDVCLQSPTGSGKTRMASELLRRADLRGEGACFYVNRKILISQTSHRFDDLGIRHGVRAADHDEGWDSFARIQICSAPTENIRVYKESPEQWFLHPSKLIIVDEAHIQKGSTMNRIIKDHKKNGAQVVLLSATPVGLHKMADEIVIGGTMKEFRDCGALVPAIVRSIEQPDLSRVKRAPTGEFMMGAKMQKVYTQTIIGNVVDRWNRYNPDARPTMLYAPGKEESVWFTQQFEKAGVRWCHVDATDAWLDGKRYTLSRKVWAEILEQYIDGSIKGISCRFKLREGIDVPSTFHVILATPIGSIQSYIQTIGRALRAAPGKDSCLITDHGGNYLRHGSPNCDRPWQEMWKMTSSVASKLHESLIRNKAEPEPLRCPKCEGERLRGLKCPHCGHEHTKSVREVIQADGSLKIKEGDIIPRKHCMVRSDTQTKWDKLYWGYKRKGLKKSFSQMEAFFVQVHGYWPDRVLNNMPILDVHWYRNVPDLSPADLRIKA